MSDSNQNAASSQSAKRRYTAAPVPVTAPNRNDYESLTSSHRDERAINAITGQPWPTLDEMTAERAAQLAEWAADRASERDEQTEQTRRAAIEQARDWLIGHLSPDLRAALRAVPACDEERLRAAIESEDYYRDAASTLAAVALLDLAGTDLDPQATHADHECGRWRIEQYGQWWKLNGPGDFAAILCHTEDAPGKTLDGVILDALRDFPAWRAGQAERASQKERQERRKRRPAPRYQALYGEQGLLGYDTPHHVRLCVLNPLAAEEAIEYDGALVDMGEGWLLLDSDDGKQYAIPVARIQDVQPLADLSGEGGDPDAA